MQWRIVSFVLATIACSLQAGGIFWTDRGAGQLKRMQFDGSSLQTIALAGSVMSPGSNIRGIALDPGHDRFFWADNGTDRLLRANYDGSSSEVLHTISGGNSFPADVRWDRFGQHVYWCDQLRNRIQRSAATGLDVADVITNAAPTGPYFMDLDVRGGRLYWGDFDGGMIYRSHLDGSARQTLLVGNNKTRGIQVDPEGGMLYWINRDDKKVHRCPLSVFTATPIDLTHPSVETLYTGLDTPHGLVLDAPARKLYWADTGSNTGIGAGDRAVSRGDIDGSTPLEVLAIGAEPWGVDIDRRCSTYVEWRRRVFRKDAPPAQTGAEADPDGDMIPNALEYAFNLAPLHVDSAGLPEGLLVRGSATGVLHHGLRFRRRIGTSDLTFQVQVSTDLQTWTANSVDLATIEAAVSPIGDGMEEVTAHTRYDVSGYSRHFIRLKVALAGMTAVKSEFEYLPSTGLNSAEIQARF